MRPTPTGATRPKQRPRGQGHLLTEVFNLWRGGADLHREDIEALAAKAGLNIAPGRLRNLGQASERNQPITPHELLALMRAWSKEEYEWRRGEDARATKADAPAPVQVRVQAPRPSAAAPEPAPAGNGVAAPAPPAGPREAGGQDAHRARLRARPRPGPKTRSNRDGAQAAVWRALRQLDGGETTTRALAKATGVKARTVSAYVTALHRAGVLAQVEPQAPTSGGSAPAVYRAARVLVPLVPVVREQDRVAYDPNAPGPLHEQG